MSALSFAKLGQQKVTVPAILLVFLLYAGWSAKDFTIEGLDEFFISEAEGTEMVKQITTLNVTLTSYISKQEIKEINAEIREIGDQITATQLWIAANGNNEIATSRLSDLMERQYALEDKKKCLLNESITNKELCDVE